MDTLQEKGIPSSKSRGSDGFDLFRLFFAILYCVLNLLRFLAECLIVPYRTAPYYYLLANRQAGSQNEIILKIQCNKNMDKINLAIIENCEYISKREPAIRNAVEIARKFAFPKLKINWNIDVVLRSSKTKYADAKDFISGHTYESDFIVLYVEEKFKPFEIAEVLIHELCHAARWGKNDEWLSTLYDALIFEGIAVYFTEEFCKDKSEHQFYMDVVTKRTDSENKKILKTLKEQLENTNYDYDKFFTGNGKDLPYWAGYSLGYYLVKKYLKKTSKKIEDAFADKYSDIESAL